jgi:hypothetical protein
MTRIVCRLQPKKTTPTTGIRLAMSRRIAEREYAVRRYSSNARPRAETVIDPAARTRAA